MQQVLPIGQIKANDNNPRFIKDERFKQLTESLVQFPEMLQLRPLVVDEDFVVLGGNMRLRAVLHLRKLEEDDKQGDIEHAVFHRGLVLDTMGNTLAEASVEQKAAYRAQLQELFYGETLPITIATGLSEAQKKEFVIKDNASFGSWDMDALANSWGDLPLDSWGLDLPKDWLEPESIELPEDELSVPLCVMKITFEGPEQLQKAEIAIQEIIDRQFPGAHFVISNAGKLKD
jgi:hypothetical protein